MSEQPSKPSKTSKTSKTSNSMNDALQYYAKSTATNRLFCEAKLKEYRRISLTYTTTVEADRVYRRCLYFINT